MMNTIQNQNLMNKRFQTMPVAKPVAFKGNIKLANAPKQEILEAFEVISSVNPQNAQKYAKQLHAWSTAKESKNSADLYHQIMNLLKVDEQSKTVIKKANILDSIKVGDSKEMVAIGEADNKLKKFLENAFLPVKWAVDIFKGTKSSFSLLTAEGKAKKLAKLEKEIADRHLTGSFNHYLEKNKKVSKLKAAQNFIDETKCLSTKEKIKDIKAQILFVKEQTTRVAKDLEKKFGRKPSHEEVIKEVTENYRKAMEDGWASGDRISYKPHVYSNWNKFMASSLTALFLIADAYNLAMLHGKGDNKTARTKAAQRGVQEASRVAFSTYLVTATNNIFSSIYNKSLVGAIAVTAGNVTAYEALARKSVGTPIGKQKDQATLFAIEKKNAASNNPVMKWIGGIIGKKSLPAQQHPQAAKPEVKQTKLTA